MDKRRGRLPDGTAVGLIRPKFKEWGFTVIIVVKNKSPAGSPSTIQALFSVAGECQGLGSFRPNCKGPFGTFAVVKFEDITPKEWLEEEKLSKQSGPAVEVNYAGTQENGEPADADEARTAALAGTAPDDNGDGKPKRARRGRLAAVAAVLIAIGSFLHLV
ncbi:MAG: hypothetical protein Q7S15_02490 [bacterium]|nr:hypothetical protein [bacterium]